MIQRYFHNWERQLADVSKNDRKVRPFEWGVDWIDTVGNREPGAGNRGDRERVSSWVEEIMRDTDAFFTPQPATDYALNDGVLTYTTGFKTPHPENNLVRARYFPADPIRKPKPGGRRRAVVVLAQWNSDSEGHVGLCKILSKLGIASLRLSLPYHDQRMPPELTRAD